MTAYAAIEKQNMCFKSIKNKKTQRTQEQTQKQ